MSLPGPSRRITVPEPDRVNAPAPEPDIHPAEPEPAAEPGPAEAPEPARDPEPVPA